MNENTEIAAPYANSKAYVQLLLFIGITCLFLFILSVVIAICQFSGIIDIVAIYNPDAYSDPTVMSSAKIIQIVSDIGTFILPAIAFAFLVSKNKAEYLQVNKTGRLSVLLLGGLLMLCASPLINYMAELNSYLKLPEALNGLENWMKDTENKEDALEAAFMTHQSIKDFIVNLFMFGLVAAVAEEIFFRGVLQKLFVKMTKNIHWGIWITAIIFSAIHLQFYGFFPRMLMGVFLGYLLYWSGSLWATIFAHFINNATVVLFAFLEERNIIPNSVDKVGLQSSDYWYIIGSTGMVMLLMVVIYRLSKPAVNYELQE